MRRLTIVFAAVCALAWGFAAGPAGADEHGKHQGGVGGGGGAGSHQSAGGGGGAVQQGSGKHGSGKHGLGKHGGGESDDENEQGSGGRGRGGGGYGRGPVAPPYWGGEHRRFPPGYGPPPMPGWFGYR